MLAKLLANRKAKNTFLIIGMFLIVFVALMPIKIQAFGIPFYDLPSAADVAGSIANKIGDLLLEALAWMGTIITGICGGTLWLVGNFFDLSVWLSITKIGTWFSNEGVANAWRLMRDLANITFIFILLYIAIGTVFDLQGIGGNAQKLVVNVIIIALLVNFSGFLTRVVIDATNIVAYEFYDAMDKGGTTATAESGTGIDRLHNIGSRLVVKMSLASYFAKPNEQNRDVPTVNKNSFFGIIANTVGTIIVIMIASFVLLVASILFLIRTIVLLFIYIVSPLAIASSVIPYAKFNFFNKWLNKLINQSLVAPGFLIPLYIVFILLDSGMTSLMSDTEGKIAGNLGTVVLSNILIIGLLILSIKIARDVGAAGIGIATAVGGAGALLAAKGSVGLARRLPRFATETRRVAGVVASEGRSYGIGEGLSALYHEGGGTLIRGAKETSGAAWKEITETAKKTGAGKGVKGFMESPLLGTADIITAGAEAAGLGSVGIFGSTAKERAESKKKEKEEKEEEKKKELKGKEDQLKAAANTAAAEAILGTMTDSDVKEISGDTLSQQPVATALTWSNLDALQKGGKLTSAQKRQIRTYIQSYATTRAAMTPPPAATGGILYMTTGTNANSWQ